MDKYYVKIIVEGNEEEAFFDVVKAAGIHEKFVIDVENSRGYGGIADAFLSALREGELFDCVLCVYDVDNRVSESNSPFNITRKQLLSILGEAMVVDAVSFCTNPNILQYFLLAVDELPRVSLTGTSKTANTIYVHRYWKQIASNKTDEKGRKTKSFYDASKWQLDIMKYSVINDPHGYSNLLSNAEKLPQNYKEELPGGNLLPLLIALRDGDEGFFERIHLLIDAM